MMIITLAEVKLARPVMSELRERLAAMQTPNFVLSALNRCFARYFVINLS